MNASALWRQAATATLALATFAAAAESGHSAIAYSTGSFIPTDPTAAVNTGFGDIKLLSDGSVSSPCG